MRFGGGETWAHQAEGSEARPKGGAAANEELKARRGQSGGGQLGTNPRRGKARAGKAEESDQDRGQELRGQAPNEGQEPEARQIQIQVPVRQWLRIAHGVQ